MSIEKTIFTGTSQTANEPEVLAWLQANATEYFDSVVTDSSHRILCEIGDVAVLTLSFTSIFRNSVHLLNGEAMTAYNTGDRFTLAYKTSKGLILHSYDYGDIIITKSSKGTTAILWQIKTTESYYSWIVADFTYSSEFFALTSDMSWSDTMSRMIHTAPIMGMTGIVCYGDCYLPNLFIASYSQFGNTRCEFSIGDTDYVMSYGIALRD